MRGGRAHPVLRGGAGLSARCRLGFGSVRGHRVMQDLGQGCLSPRNGETSNRPAPGSRKHGTSN